MTVSAAQYADSFADSDAIRHSRPLPFGERIVLEEPLALELGGHLSGVVVTYETYGRLNQRHDNAILICHALSGDSHVAQHTPDDDPGWWDIVVGPGKPIDTNRFFVVCPNILGGCRGSTGPGSINPETRRLYAADFPAITVGDMVEVQRRLMDKLQIECWDAVVGGSLGGHMAITWATRLPTRVRAVVALATSSRLTSQAIAFDIVGRNAILRDPDFQNGHYSVHGRKPSIGLAIARMLGHITYLSREAMTTKFDRHRLDPRSIHTQFETKFAVGSYLAYQGDRFVERFDANSYLALTTALDRFDLGESQEALMHALRPSTCRWLLISFSSDWLFPPFQSQQLANALLLENKPVTYCNVSSECGHDAFLLPNDLPLYGELLRAFLEQSSANVPTAAISKATDDVGAESQFWPTVPLSTTVSTPDAARHHRVDYDAILDLIPITASVLDLGCGRGGLLSRLQQRGQQHLLGVEIDAQAQLVCVRRGLNVLHADINQGLPTFSDHQFDYVILSQTLQVVANVEQLLLDMLCVGHHVIVSFPNIGYWEYRIQLSTAGRAPRLYGIDGFSWFNTPGVRFLSIADFEEFCRERDVVIHRRIALDTESGQEVTADPNFDADLGIFVLGR